MSDRSTTWLRGPAAALAGAGLLLLVACDPAGGGGDDAAAGGDAPAAATDGTARAGSGGGTVTPAAWDPGPTVPGGPRIAFESEILDLGTFREDDSRTGVFRFANVGDAPLVLEDPKPTCGCTATDLVKKVYQPGEQGEIEIEFDPTSPGEQKKYVVVVSNGSEQPVRLEVLADPRAILAIEPRILKLDAARLGETHVRTVELLPMNERFEVVDVTTTNPSIGAVPGTRQADGTIPLQVTVPGDLPWGPVFSWVEVTVQGPDEQGRPLRFSSRFRVQGSLYGEVFAEPAIMNTFRFGVDPGQTFQRELLLARRGNEELELEVLNVDFPGATDALVRIEPAPAGAKRVVLEAIAGPAVPLARGVVQLRTNVDGPESVISLPISGRIGPRR